VACSMSLASRMSVPSRPPGGIKIGGGGVASTAKMLARPEVPPKERLPSTDALVLWPSDGGNQ
jgi:hypothetical protein